jgi:hypothetical protein
MTTDNKKMPLSFSTGQWVYGFNAAGMYRQSWVNDFPINP